MARNKREPAGQAPQQAALSAESQAALIALADMMQAEHPLHAIHCFLALLSRTDLSPLQQVQSRLQLGTLLLEHTANIKVGASNAAQSLHTHEGMLCLTSDAMSCYACRMHMLSCLKRWVASNKHVLLMLCNMLCSLTLFYAVRAVVLRAACCGRG